MALGGFKKFHTHDAHHIERFKDTPGDFNRLAGYRYRASGNIEDVICVAILDYAEMEELAIDTAPGDDRDFTPEGNELFEDERLRGQGSEGRSGHRLRSYFLLTLAVIAKGGGLQDGRVWEAD